MVPRYIYRGCETTDDPRLGLRAARPEASTSLQDAVLGIVRHTQFIHCTRSALSAIFYGTTWEGQRDCDVAKIDLQKVPGHRLRDVSSLCGANHFGLTGKALQFATDSQEMVLEAAPGSGPLFIPPDAITIHPVRLAMLSERQRTAGERRHRRRWTKLLQKGRRMQAFCSATPVQLEEYIVRSIYAPPRYYGGLAGTRTYHFNHECTDMDGDASGGGEEPPQGWRACHHCMLRPGSDAPRAGPDEHQLSTVQPMTGENAGLFTSLRRGVASGHEGATTDTEHSRCGRRRKRRRIRNGYRVGLEQMTAPVTITVLNRTAYSVEVTVDNGPPSPSPSPSHAVCHFFWYELDAPRDEQLEMRQLNLYSMRSAAAHHVVWLWCYQTFGNLPTGVMSKDANELLAFDEFSSALVAPDRSTIFSNRRRNRRTEGRHVAHLSDLLRIIILRKFAGWWLDLDTIVLKPLPTASQYYFSTIPEKRTECGGERSGRANENEQIWGGQNTALLQEWDGKDSFQNTPIYVAKCDDPLVVAWEARIKPLVLGPHPLEWLTVIRKMESIIVDMHLQRFICPPIFFCPYPFWKTDMLLQPASNDSSTAYATPLPSFDEVLQQSYVIQTFFMSSSSRATESRGDAWLRLQLQRTCFFRDILEHVGMYTR